MGRVTSRGSCWVRILALFHLTLLFLPHESHGLSCFQCSEFAGNIPCPDVGSDSPVAWSDSNPNQYYALTGSGMSCVVGYSRDTGVVYFQVIWLKKKTGLKQS